MGGKKMKKRKAALALGLCCVVGLCGAALTACGGGDDDEKEFKPQHSDYYVIGEFTDSALSTGAAWGTFHGNPKDVPDAASFKTTKNKEKFELEMNLYEGNKFKIILCSEYKKYEDAKAAYDAAITADPDQTTVPEPSADAYAWTGAVTAEFIAPTDDSAEWAEYIVDPDPDHAEMGGDNITVKHDGKYKLTLDTTSAPTMMKFEYVGEAPIPDWTVDVYTKGSWDTNWADSIKLSTTTLDNDHRTFDGSVEFKAGVEFGFYTSAPVTGDAQPVQISWGGASVMSYAQDYVEDNKHIDFSSSNGKVSAEGAGTYTFTVTLNEKGGFESIVFKTFTAAAPTPAPAE